jgi:hypothetical protein
MRKVFFGGMVLLGLLSCGGGRGGSSGILSREKMQAVMWDIIAADVLTDRFIKKDSSKNAAAENMQLKNKIFALHKVTREDYYKSYDYYIAHSDLMKVILDSMAAKAERERMKILERHAGVKLKKIE